MFKTKREARLNIKLHASRFVLNINYPINYFIIFFVNEHSC